MCIVRKRLSLSLLFIGAYMLLVARPAFAQGGAGILAGISGDPTQFYFGGHVDVKEVVDKFWFRPNAEIGFGNNRTVFALNGEFAYFTPLKTKNDDWKVYLGGGPAVVISTLRGGPTNTTDTGPGFNFLVGLTRKQGLFAEIKAGALDSPGLKFGIGWAWSRR